MKDKKGKVPSLLCTPRMRSRCFLNATIFVYCRSGRRSALAAASLVKLGYTKVFDLGGIIDWPYEVIK